MEPHHTLPNLHKRFHGLSILFYVLVFPKLSTFFFLIEYKHVPLEFWGGIDRTSSIDGANWATKGASTRPSFLEAML